MQELEKAGISFPFIFFSSANSILLRFVDDTFNPNQTSTIGIAFSSFCILYRIDAVGVDFKPKVMKVRNMKIQVTIWDTGTSHLYSIHQQLARSDSERSPQDTTRVLRESSSVCRFLEYSLLVYDVTRRDTFENLSSWFAECKNYCSNEGKDAIKLIVANKIDLVFSFYFVVDRLGQSRCIDQRRREFGKRKCI